MESDEQILSSSFSSSSSSSNSSFSITRTRTTRKILAAALPRRAATMSRSFHQSAQIFAPGSGTGVPPSVAPTSKSAVSRISKSANRE